ncbi:MAG: flagellar biosynthesis protein FlhB [Phycisphaerae bacterium]|nr:flagellar biosynthesis protein FlhB [Phycisphaerae bacterium]
MADDLGEKTEAPTPRRLEEARNRGQVARSQDLSAAVLLLGGLLGLLVIGPDIWGGLLGNMRLGLGADRLTPEGDLGTLALAMAGGAFKNVVVLMLILAVVALTVMYAQVGFLFTATPLTPSLAKLNPISGFKRLFSSRKVVELLLNLAKLSLVGGVAYLTVRSFEDRLVLAASVGFPTVFSMIWEMLFKLGLYLALVMLVLALLDYTYQRYRHTKELKMSKEEVKEELRSMEGDPILKRRRRQVQMQLAMQRMRKEVPEADVVVTNPTHYAVALKYTPDSMSAPKVVAKGADFLALRIREIAAAAGVPIVERPVLARMLFAEVEVGREVPGKFFEAVAEILAYVYELTGKNMRPKPVAVGMGN